MAGFAGILFIPTFVLLGVLAQNYNGLNGTISGLEFTSVGLAQRVNFFIFGLLLIAFAFGLFKELRKRKGRAFWLIPLFQFLSGIGVMGDALFIYDPLHLACDLIAFNSAVMVLFLFAWRLWGDQVWKGWSSYSIITAILMMVFLASFGLANHFGGPAGVLEKLATVVRTTWSVLLAGKILAGSTP